MLSDKPVLATVAVKDLDVAKKFYEDKLGLESIKDREGEHGLVYKAGTTRLFVYTSGFAGTNQATAATWNVGNDIDKCVEELQAKGVSFEEYDMPNIERDGAIHTSGNIKSAWFKDPDGNIISINNA